MASLHRGAYRAQFPADLMSGFQTASRLTADSATGGPAQSHVLVVEDDRDTREVLKLIFELEGMAVTEASDGLEALDRLHQLREADPDCPCAVVLDLMMPRCSGLEFRRRQLDDSLIADIPIIVLSAILDQVKLDALGPFAQVPKPFDPEQLVQAVRRACETRPNPERAQ